MEGGLCDQLLKTTKDVVWEGAEVCVGNVPAQTNTNMLVFSRVTHILISECMPPSTNVFSVCYIEQAFVQFFFSSENLD